MIYCLERWHNALLFLCSKPYPEFRPAFLYLHNKTQNRFEIARLKTREFSKHQLWKISDGVEKKIF